MLRLLLEADCSLKEFWKKWIIKHAIYAAAESWNDIQNVTLQRSWFKFSPELKDYVNCSGIEENVMSPVQFLNTVKNVVEFGNVTLADVEERLNSDLNEPGYQILDNAEFTSTFQSVNNINQDTDEEANVEEVLYTRIQFPPKMY